MKDLVYSYNETLIFTDTLDSNIKASYLGLHLKEYKGRKL